MVSASLLLLATRQNPFSDLLDQASAAPAETIKAQISTQCRYLGDRFEFVDEFKSDTLGRRTTNMSPLEELIARGAAAVPYLASQLARKDPTKFTIQGSADVQAVAYEFYDPKVRKPDTDYWDVVTMDQVRGAPPMVHTVTRGDLAYFALGQIVNRWYGTYFPGKITLFCSASDHPEIQKQAQVDWGNLTSQDLEKTLREDVRHPDTYARMTFGFARYRSYFPGEAPTLAVEALRGTYGRSAAGKPDISPYSFWTELQPIGNSDLDQIAYQQLTRTDRENNFLSDYELTRYQVLLYLKDRRDYTTIAINYAKDFVKKRQDPYGYYARFLRMYVRGK